MVGEETLAEQNQGQLSGHIDANGEANSSREPELSFPHVQHTNTRTNTTTHPWPCDKL